jgi:hypothetical protein
MFSLGNIRVLNIRITIALVTIFRDRSLSVSHITKDLASRYVALPAMADALCGPSNPLQSFQKHAYADRTLLQDRISGPRHSPAQASLTTVLLLLDCS